MFAVKALLLGLFCCLALASPAVAGFEESPSDSYQEARWFLPMEATLGSPFGPRWGRMHNGLDIEGWAETRVHATRTGVVKAVGWLNGYSGLGLVVRIRHEGGFESLYAHLARSLVKRGDVVVAGQRIARAGCTGSCTGVHLHFELRKRGKLVDPLKYLGRKAFARL